MKADDLDSVTDPSKLSESDFAPGTKWTPAGWTKGNPKYVAKSSKLTLTDNNKNWKLFQDDRFSFTLKATVNKSDVVKDRPILVGTISLLNSSKHVGDLGLQIAPSYFNDQNTDVMWKGIKIGYLKAVNEGNSLANANDISSHIDSNEIDIYFIPTETKTHLASDLNFQFNMYAPSASSGMRVNISTVNGQTGTYYDYSNSLFLNSNYAIATSSNVYPVKFDNSVRIATTRDVNNVTGRFYGNEQSEFIYDLYFTTKPITIQRVIKVDNLDHSWKPALVRVFGTYRLHNNKDQSYSDPSPINTNFSSLFLKARKDNLSANDLLTATPINTASYSKQSDGSYLISYKIDSNFFSKEETEKALSDLNKYSFVTNISPKDKNTYDYSMQHYAKNDWTPNIITIRFECNSYNNRIKNILHAINITPNTTPYSIMLANRLNGSSANAELYRTALVHYLDSSKDSPVSNDSIMGTKNNATNYTLNIPKGYILDTKSGKNVDGKQYKWSTDKKSIAYTFNEDQKLNDANPINIYITHGTHNTNDNSGKSTRTIQYTGLPDNLKPKDNVQTVLFKRSGVTDDVTGETTYGDWQPQAGNGHYTAVPSPTFAGYKPDQEVIPDTAATPNKNENVTVNYSRTNQNAKLTVHDDTANTDLNDYTENSTGLYQDQITFKTAPSAVEQELKDKGYNIVSDSFKDSPTYNADDSKNNFVIHVTHKIVPVTPDHPKTPTDIIPDTKQHYPTDVDTNDLNKDVQRSIFYKYEDNTQAEPTVVQKAHFSRTVKVDAVTQKIVDNGTWSTKDNYPEVATKSIDGYTPDKTKVDSATPSMTTNQDQTVVYHANDEDAAITYIDDTTGKVLKTDTQKAKYKQTIKFATDPNTQIQTYKDQGYVLVSSDWKDGSTYQTDPARNKFTVHLKHGISTVTPDKPKKSTDIIPGTKQHYPTGVDANDLNQSQQRQITYTYSDSKKQASSTVTQKATFHRTATVDNVTGKTTYTDWTTSDQYPEVKSPAIEGYTPDKSNVPVTKPVLNTKQDVAVIYNPNPEQVDVIAQDNTGKQLSKSTLHGNYNTDYTATTPVLKGYHLIKMPTNTHGTYKTHNDPIIYIYAPDSNSVPEQTDGTPKPDKSSYPDDITPAKRSNKLPETGSINLVSDLNSVANNITHALQHLLH